MMGRLKMLADTRGIKIEDRDKKELTNKFSTMPPHPDVPPALRKLRSFSIHFGLMRQCRRITRSAR